MGLNFKIKICYFEILTMDFEEQELFPFSRFCTSLWQRMRKNLHRTLEFGTGTYDPV